jgi:hypothetical protein
MKSWAIRIGMGFLTMALSAGGAHGVIEETAPATVTVDPALATADPGTRVTGAASARRGAGKRGEL